MDHIELEHDGCRKSPDTSIFGLTFRFRKKSVCSRYTISTIRKGRSVLGRNHNGLHGRYR